MHVLQSLVQGLLSQLPEDPASTIITVKSDAIATSSSNGQKSIADGPVYDPAIVYVLELCTVLALRDDESVRLLGNDVAEALQNVMRNTQSYHNTMISRAVFYLLQLLHASYVS